MTRRRESLARLGRRLPARAAWRSREQLRRGFRADGEYEAWACLITPPMDVESLYSGRSSVNRPALYGGAAPAPSGIAAERWPLFWTVPHAGSNSEAQPRKLA